MRTLRTITELREALGGPRRAGDRIGLVATMGALHAGHVSLLRAAREGCDLVVMSLFVNPAQFDDTEDLARYPRDEAADLATAQAAGVDVVFAPPADELYPAGFDTWVEPGRLATVCTKLFTIVAPTVAYFGQKDAQQVAVLRRVVADLDLPLEVVAVPTVRDPDGLALSSRNAFLSPAERTVALALPRALEAGAEAHRDGADPVAAARGVLDDEPALTVEYVAIAEFDVPTLVAAVRIGATRLIDNLRLGASR